MLVGKKSIIFLTFWQELPLLGVSDNSFNTTNHAKKNYTTSYCLQRETRAEKIISQACLLTFPLCALMLAQLTGWMLSTFHWLKAPSAHKWMINAPHLLSDGRRESRASDDSFLLSGWVMLSMRSTHISITLPNNWSIWWGEKRLKEARWTKEMTHTHTHSLTTQNKLYW